MLQKIKMYLLSFSALILFIAPLALAIGMAHAQSPGASGNLNPGGFAGCGSSLTFDNKSGNCIKDNSGSISNVIKAGINLFSIVVGAIAVIMVIYGGFRYVTSSGKDDNVKGAKSTIMYALIGLVIIALAQILVRFVLTKSTSAASGS